MRPTTQDHFMRYIATDEGATYVTSDLFAERCEQLFARLNAGEEMRAQDAAMLVGLPWEVFRHLYAHWLALSHMLMNAPISRIIN